MPFLRMLIPLIIGIGCYKWIGIRSVVVPISVFILLIIYRIVFVKRLSFQNRFWYGYLLQLIVFLVGYTCASYQDAIKDHDHFSNYASSGSNAYYGVITSIKERANRYEAVVCVHKLLKDGKTIPVSGKLNTYIPYSVDSTLHIGKHIGLAAEIIRHPEPKNPGVFNYGGYLEKQRIYHQTQSIDQFEVISTCTSTRYWMSRYRERILKVFHKHIDGQQNYAIAASIILGYRDAIDYETKRAFAETGSIHILAVSGMHVGIIWFFAGLFINRINNRRSWYKYLRVGISIVVIWGFVFLAGLPPSAVRAAWLFSLVSASKLIQGDSNLFHRLATAAFLMLCWNTNYLWDVGFQLSFSAVLGIALFYPIWDRLAYFKDRFRRYFWSGMGMTIGATLGTMPLTMFYFQYFPISGLLSSVIVVALATIILGTGILFLISFWISTLGVEMDVVLGFMGDVLNTILYGLQYSVKAFDAIPYGIVEGISLSILAVILMYVLLISLRALWHSRNKAFIYSSTLALVVLTFLSLHRTMASQEKKQIVIYHDYRNNAIELFDRGQSLLISQEKIDKNQSVFLNKGLHIQNQVGNAQSILYPNSIESGAYYFHESALKFYDIELLIISSPADVMGKEEILWDYILLVDNADVTVNQLFESVRFDNLIFGASNWGSRIEEWKKTCKEMDIPYVDIRNTKALIIDVVEEEA